MSGPDRTPLVRCPYCGRLVGVMAADGCFLLHPRDVGGDRHHGHCRGSGRRPSEIDVPDEVEVER